MDRYPVWVIGKHLPASGDVVLVRGMAEGESYVTLQIRDWFQESGYGKTWLAYRNKPKGEWK